ncbi:MAG: 6-bladed beta-propeller [Gammaproteobacteria bacterium]|nr:6-bladed beta-propeller [Gammaproteobacteria bacterium]
MSNNNTRQIGRLLITSLLALLLASCASPPDTDEEFRAPVFPSPPDPPRFIFERTILGTGSARRESDEDRLRSLLTGTTTRAGSGFSKPFDVAVRQGRVYVTDTVNRAILVVDAPNERGFTFGDRGDDGDVSKPLGIAIDDTGTVYVADNTDRDIKIYNPDGDFIRRIDVSRWAKRPSGLDITADGSRLFLVDTGGVDTQEHRVLVIDTGKESLIRTIGSRGKGDGEFNLPRDVHLGPDGLLYVTDGGNFRVQAFTQDGEFVRTWGQPGRRLGQFSRPKGIAIDADGNVYVADAAFGNFQIFSPEGQLLLFIGTRSTKAEPAKYMLPSGIDVDEDGRIYFIDQWFRKLDVFRPVALTEQDGWLGLKADAK